MKWKKRGFIYGAGELDISWHTKYTMTPLPYLYDEHTLRIYLTMCDENNFGRLGYIDVNPNNPREILRYSKTPILNIGGRGTFDEHGVLPSSLIKKNDKIYLYYSAYQLQKSVPYSILSGLAISDDGGDFFVRNSDVPLLERRKGELFQRSAIEIMEKDNNYKMWYTSSVGWTNNGIHEVPMYDIKYLESKYLDKWDGAPEVSLKLKSNGDEYGLTTPQVFFENGRYKMFYSIRSISSGYRMGYAESTDGVTFDRLDEYMNLSPTPTEFDSEMICYGKVLTYKDKTYLFYSGNHYGLAGIGYAELEVN